MIRQFLIHPYYKATINRKFMNSPLFSIVIPTYNRANEIGRCISSVVNQTYSNWEAIVVDNYSQDNTQEIVNSFNDKRIRYFKNHNYGIISVSRNFGLDKSNGMWICFLDSDDWWMPNKLESLMPYIDEYDIIYHGFKTNAKRTRLFQRTNNMFYSIKEPTVQYVLQRGDPLSPSCTAVNMSFIGNCRFSEDKDLFAIEDYDFFLQLLLKHPRIKHLKKYLANYDITTGVSHNAIAHCTRSRRLYSKYKQYLTNEEFRNVLKLYMSIKGRAYYETNPTLARYYFKITASSSIPEIRYASFYNVLKTYILQILNWIK